MNKSNILQLVKELLEGCVVTIDGVSMQINQVEIPQYNIVITHK